MWVYEFRTEDAERFAKEQGIKTWMVRDELIFQKCPYCMNDSSKDKGKFAINLNTGQFHCFRASCAVKGNMITLAKDFNFSLGRDADTYYRIGNQRHYRVFKKNPEPIEPKDEAIEYLQSRGISSEIARRYQITADAEGNIVFPFIDEEQQMQFIKYRNPDPKEGQSKEWCERDCKPILFGMAQCDTSLKTLVITEGQLDSLSLSEAGIKNAISVPTGANGFTWVPHCWNWMSQFTKIIVFGDYEKGHITLYNEIAARWKQNVWHVREEDYQDCKDANEILQKYGAEQIRKCVARAVRKPIPRVKELSKIEYVNMYEIPKIPTGINNLDNLLCGGLPFGQVTVLTGKAGEGKSTFASQLLLSAIHNNYKCFAYSGELPNYLFKSWIDFQSAGRSETYEYIQPYAHGDSKPRRIKEDTLKKITEWYKDKVWIYDNSITEDSDESSILALLEQVINQYEVRVILIDNLMTVMDLEPSISSDKFDRQSQFMKKLTRLALQYNALIILVAHKRKNNGSSNINDDVSGSADISNLASIVMSYERHSEDADKRLLKVTKNRFTGKLFLEGFLMSYDDASKRIYMNDQEKNRVYGWSNVQPEEPEEEEFPWS